MKHWMALICLVVAFAVARAQQTGVAAEEPAPRAAAGNSAAMPKLEEEGEGIDVPELADMEEFRDWLLTLSQAQRDQLFIASDAGPIPKGLYTGFMLSDRPNFEDFDISITKKTIMTFVFDRWVGKSFDGEGNLANILRDETGFEKKDLKGTLTLGKGYSDDKDSWIAEYGESTAYNFILDEFREIKPDFLFGKTYLVPPKKGDKVFFECGLVKIGDETPAGKTPSEFLLENLSEVEPTAISEPVVPASEPIVPASEPIVLVSEGAPRKKSNHTKAKDNKEGDGANVGVEPLVRAQDDADAADADAVDASSMPTPEAEAPEEESDLELEAIMD